MIIFVLILIQVVSSSWIDGAINVGDFFNNTIFECAAFTTYKMAMGVSLKQFVFDGPLLKGSNDAFFFMDHVPCPEGGNCSN
jgi:hypothetical protein